MRKKLNQLDLFSGIGGFHMGLERAGYKVKSYFSEIDKHAVAVYKHQFKNAEYVGSVTDVRGEQLPKIDIITFGSPCQDFSLAGKRMGMDGQRSSLILEAIRLIDEPTRSIYLGNVKGAFSSNSGEDFAAILQAFTNIGGTIDLNGNCVIQRTTFPKTGSGYTLSDILQKPSEIGEEFFLSQQQVERITNWNAQEKPLQNALPREDKKGTPECNS